MGERVKRSRKKIGLTILIVSAATLLLIAIGLQTALFIANASAVYWHPDYKREDLTEILQKEVLTDDDYDLLCRQTGLGRAGVDRCFARGEEGKRTLLQIQGDYFGEYQTTNRYFAPFFSTSYVDRDVTHCYLEEGDVVITSSTRFAGIDMGHAGLVTDAADGGVLQTSAYGSKSSIDSIGDFTDRVTFLILSPKTEGTTKNEVARFARENLVGLKYDITAGVLSDKNKCQRTQCAHIVWYAYKQFGIDLDSDGGLVVTPQDLASSEQMEVVQVFGFDPETLWR